MPKVGKPAFKQITERSKCMTKKHRRQLLDRSGCSFTDLLIKRLKLFRFLNDLVYFLHLLRAPIALSDLP